MDKRLKAAIIAVLSLSFILAITVAGANTVRRAAVSDGNDTRQEIVRLFYSNTALYDEVFAAVKKAVPAGRECLIITDGEKAGDVKVKYGDVEDTADDSLRELIERFVEITHCDAIYSDGSRFYVKREFETAVNRRSEANIIRNYDHESELPEGAKELSNGWYYAEYELE